MATRPNTASVQDMPPPGGYPSFPLKSSIRPRGPPGWFIWAAICGATVYGFYQIGRTNEEKRMVNKERRESRMAILPYLQSEQDKLLAARIRENLEKEREIMKDVPGWVVGEPIYSKRWMPPSKWI